ncbi:hypothetical protein KPH14_008130 [Odynerus spinipes]|uniref:Uncharacterized protein n=1 Tax=Odynerus spinipes TaxID=1348599 RepID=A0AAD9RKE3_9HYME|nr:hypothetical protein KPH14_008130 [Odynerus spinipes]
MNTRDQANSNPKPLNFESSSTEFSTSKERVDLLQDFQPQELQVDIRSQSKEPRQVLKKYIRKKETDHVTEIGMATNARILPRNARLSLPILRVESLENMSHTKLIYPKFANKNEINIEHNGDGDVTIHEINCEISKKETLHEVSFDDDNKKDFHEKENREIGDTVKLISQDVSRIEGTPSDNPIMVEEQSTDSRHHLKRDSHEEHLRENKKPIDEQIQSVSKRASEEYSSFKDSTLNWKFSEACSSLRNKNCTAVPSGFIAHIEENAQNKQILIDTRKRHFHQRRNQNETMNQHVRFNSSYSFLRKCLANKLDKHANSYLPTSINENIKEDSLYQRVRRYCGKNMINDLSRFQYCCQGDYDEPYRRWDIQKGMLGCSRNEHRPCICRVRGNSSISCRCKRKVIPSSQRVTFCLPSKKETT